MWCLRIEAQAHTFSDTQVGEPLTYIVGLAIKGRYLKLYNFLDKNKKLTFMVLPKSQLFYLSFIEIDKSK